MNQEQINLNFQERLSDLEVQQQIMTTFLAAVIETHPSPQDLKDRFTIASEWLLSSAIQKPLPESWFQQLNCYRDVLYHLLDQRIVEVK